MLTVGMPLIVISMMVHLQAAPDDVIQNMKCIYKLIYVDTALREGGREKISVMYSLRKQSIMLYSNMSLCL